MSPAVIVLSLASGSTLKQSLGEAVCVCVSVLHVFIKS